MIGICATFSCQSGKNEEFERLLGDFATTVKAKESGAIVYQLCQNKKNKDEYFMLEIYTSQDALDAHNKTDHMVALIGQIGGLLAAPPVILQGEAVH